jgi:signal transduction histidine kinase
MRALAATREAIALAKRSRMIRALRTSRYVSMRLSNLRHSTSFRLGLLFAGFFGAALLLLFSFVYWWTRDYVVREVDAWLARETAGRAVLAAADVERTLNARAIVQPDDLHPIALFNSNGDWLAGNRVSLPQGAPPFDQPFIFTVQQGSEAALFRGIVHRMPTGEALLVAQDMRGAQAFRQAILSALLPAAAAALLFGLAGAVVAGRGALGRIEGVTRTIERIVNGNLSERLPSDGRGGDINRLIEVVNGMLDEIERLVHEVKGVTEDIAHDLRTPLTRLLAGLERVHHRATSVAEYEVAMDAIGAAIIETKGILATFAALLRIAEVESGARRAGFTTVDLNAVAADVAEFYEPVAEAKGTSLSLEPAAEVSAETAGDPSLLFEAIGNLVENAIKYSPAGSSVRMRVVATRDRVGIEISDTGPGIPAEGRDTVLRRFHRVDRSSTIPGSGLGLSLVAAVATLHEFHLAIEDAHPGCRVILWSDGPPARNRNTAPLADQTELA